VVANPTLEDQLWLLDRLCLAGCIVSDLAEHFELLPQAAQLPEVRVGRPATSRRMTAESVALKVASSADRMKQLANEVQFLLHLHHDGIVGAYGIYSVKAQGQRSLGMLLDYKDGGDLTSWIPSEGLPEWIVRSLMAQIGDGMVYLHGLSAVHRDIKPSNVLCERTDDGSVKVVLSDFGLAAHIMDRETMAQRCGTGGFIAPEMFQEDWSEELRTVTAYTKIDVFSFGMLLYTTATGSNPLLDESLDLTYRRNARGLLSLANMKDHSDQLKTLLSCVCAKDPRRRYLSSEALAHPWFSSYQELSYSNGEGKYAKVTWAAFEDASHKF
jgi:serine/threonine protein kinase